MRFSIYLILILSLWSELAIAQWGVALGTGSYMGDRHYGVAYTSESGNHQTEFSYGTTPGIIGDEVRQLSLKYIYSPFHSSYRGVTTNWIGLGAMVTRCLCEETFVENSDVYPEDDYYDETAYRFGLVLASTVQWKNWEAYWDWTLLDQVAIAVYNNDRFRDRAERYWASGVGLRYYF